MKRSSTPRVLRPGTGWASKKICPGILVIPKTNSHPEDSTGEETSFKVINGELRPFEQQTDSFEINGSDQDFVLTETHGPSVEVHITSAENVVDEPLPVYEVTVNTDTAVAAEYGFLQEAELEDDPTLLCISDELVEQQQDEGEFEDYDDTSGLGDLPSTAELCRICACTASDLVPIYSEEGINFQLANKILRHLPIKVNEDDRLPLHVCSTCIAQINICHEFVKMCSEADIRLRIMLDQEDRQKENQAMSVLNIHHKKPPEEEEVNVENFDPNADQKIWTAICHNQQQQTEEKFLANEEPLPEENLVKSQQHTVTHENKKPKFKVVVVKLSNSGANLSKEAQIAKALEMIKSGDQGKQLSLSEGEKQKANWELEKKQADNNERWATQSLLCSVCSETSIGAQSFLEHHRDSHGVQLYHCNVCNMFFDSDTQLDQHREAEHRPVEEESNDNVKITNVAEIQLMNTTYQASSNLRMKVSKEFDKMDKSLKSKIVDVIQDIVLQDQLVKFQCSECKESFNTKELLRKHCKELQHKIVRPINCSLCKQAFNSYRALEDHKLTSHDDLKSFTCNYCEIKFLTKRLLLRHITEHAEYKAFICKTCGKGYNTKSGYEIHLSTHNTEKPYLCDLCGKSFKHVSNLKSHKRSHLAEEDKKRHACPYCTKRFRCKFLVEEHIRMHTGERPFACNICSKKFYKKQQLKQHTLVHSNDSYECHICGSRFNRRGNMTEHIKKHMTTKRYTCRVCKEGFETISQVVAHRKTHSNEEVTQSKIYDEADKDGSANFKCNVCNKYLATRLSLVSHIRIHTGEKPFECDFCGQRFSQKPALTYHRRRHTGEKPFQCAYCSEGFLSRNAKNIHERIHTGEKPYNCYVCGTAFRCASSLTQHLLVHSDSRPFSCHHCNKCFRRREALQVHLRIHTGEKPYACDLCGRAFTQRGDMVKHKRTHANDKPHKCSTCDIVCCSRKDLKRHELLHVDTPYIPNDPLITSFPEITIVGQDCDSIMLGETEEQEIVNELTN